MEHFDTEEVVYYDLLVYNAEEIADGTSDPKPAGRFYPDNLPSLERINESVKKAGYDTFEIEKTVTKIKRYSVK